MLRSPVPLAALDLYTAHLERETIYADRSGWPPIHHRAFLKVIAPQPAEQSAQVPRKQAERVLVPQ
jgi:hypothetical protein